MSKIYCRSCGSPTTNLSAKFCGECGKPLYAVAEKRETAPRPSPKKVVESVAGDENEYTGTEISELDVSDMIEVDTSGGRTRETILGLIGSAAPEDKPDRDVSGYLASKNIKKGKKADIQKAIFEEFAKEAGTLRKS